MILDCRACTRSFQTRRQLYRHFAEVHGDYLECNFCRFTLPGTRKYLMVRHLNNKHPDKPVLYSVKRREAFHNDASASSGYVPRPFHRSPRRQSPRRSSSKRSPSRTASATSSHPRRKYPEDSPATSTVPPPITPLRSPSISISLGSPMEVDLYGLDGPAETPPRRVLLNKKPSVASRPARAPSPLQPSRAVSLLTRPVPALASTAPDPEPAFSEPLWSACPESLLSTSSIPMSAPELPSSSTVPAVSSAESSLEPTLPPFAPPVVSLANETTSGTPFSASTESLLQELFPDLYPSSSSPEKSSLDVNTVSTVDLTTASCQPINTPSYVLHRCERSDPALASSHLANDPRLFFAGAPSAQEDDFVARIMQKANREAKSLGNSHRKVSFIPRGFGSVTRVEELSFPDGHVYKMKSTLVRDTEYSIMDSKCTQTDNVPARVIPTPVSRCDAFTQVSTVQTFTLGD